MGIWRCLIALLGGRRTEPTSEDNRFYETERQRKLAASVANEANAIQSGLRGGMHPPAP
jgi:hypothetical protein